MGKLSYIKNGLDMRHAERMKRAQEQEWSGGMYHGTDRDIDGFSPEYYGSSTGAKSAEAGVWTVDDPATARGYAEYAATDAKVKRLLDEADNYEKAGDWDNYERVVAESENLAAEFQKNPLQGQNIMPLMYRGDYLEIDMGGAEFVDVQDSIHKAIESARKQGKAGVRFSNLADDVGFSGRPATHQLTFDGKNLRSPNAAFDPAKRDSSNLLAGLGAAGIGTAALVGSEDAEAGLLTPAKLAKRVADDHLGSHRPAGRGYGDSLDALNKNIYPDDIYSKQAAQYYGTGDPSLDQDSIRIMQSLRDKPDAKVKVYRAVPKDAADEIYPQDWVTINPKYAEMHGDSWLNGEYKILETEVSAKNLFTEGNSIHEFGFDPGFDNQGNILGRIDPKLLAGVGAMGAAGIAGQRMQEELPPLDPIYAEFANRRAGKRGFWRDIKGLAETLMTVGSSMGGGVLGDLSKLSGFANPLIPVESTRQGAETIQNSLQYTPSEDADVWLEPLGRGIEAATDEGQRYMELLNDSPIGRTGQKVWNRIPERAQGLIETARDLTL